jgi:hypothetical protein
MSSEIENLPQVLACCAPRTQRPAPPDSQSRSQGRSPGRWPGMALSFIARFIFFLPISLSRWMASKRQGAAMWCGGTGLRAASDLSIEAALANRVRRNWHGYAEDRCRYRN